MEKQQYKIENVKVSVIGEVNKKKLVEPSDVTFNQEKGYLNVHFGANQVISLGENFLSKHPGVNLVHKPGASSRGKWSPEKNGKESTVKIRSIEGVNGMKFLRAGSVKYNLQRNGLDLHLDKDHTCHISNERMKSLGLGFERVSRQVARER